MTTSIYRAEWSGDLPGAEATMRGTLADCVRWAGNMPSTPGPNGPVASTSIYRPDGTIVWSWTDELLLFGRESLVTTDYAGRERIVDSRPYYADARVPTHRAVIFGALYDALPLPCTETQHSRQQILIRAAAAFGRLKLADAEDLDNWRDTKLRLAATLHGRC